MTIFRRQAFLSVLQLLSETIRRPVAINVAQLVGSRYLAVTLRFLTTAFAARLLGPESYGTVALVVAYPSLLSSIFGTKSEALTMRYMAVYKAEGKHAELLGICKLGYALDFFPAVVVSLFVVLTSRYFAVTAYDRPDVASLMNVYAASLPVVSLSNTSVAILSAHQAFRMFSGLQVLHALINMLAVVGFLILGFGVSGMILGLMVGQICIGLTLCISATHVLSRPDVGYWWRGKVSTMAPLVGELTLLLGWNYLRDTLRGVLESLPVMMLGHYRSAEEAAFYRLSANVANVGRNVETSLGRTIYPILSKQTAMAGIKAARRTIKRWTLFGGVPTALLLIGLVLLLPVIMPLVFGTNYEDTIAPAQVMLLGTAFGSLLFWVNPCYYAAKRVGVLTKAFAIYGVIAIVAIWFGIESFGLIGVVVILAAGRLVYLLVLAAGIVRDV